MKDYKEIFKLKELLEKSRIPFVWKERKESNGYQILYPGAEDVVCSVIEHQFSYGNEKDLLEIQGLMTKREEIEYSDNVLGYLTAENVFERIGKHFYNQKVDNSTDEKDFKKELTSLLNRYGWDNACETPDHILADCVERCLTNLCSIMGKNTEWHYVINDDFPKEEGVYLVCRKYHNKKYLQLVEFDGSYWVTGIKDDPENFIIAWKGESLPK
jgi:hypothetical protein